MSVCRGLIISLMETITSKTCIHCKQTLPIEQFYRKRNTADGFNPYRKDCVREMNEALKLRKAEEAKRIAELTSRNDVPRSSKGQVPRELIEVIKTNVAELRAMGWKCVITLTYPKTIKI